ncbi:tigger transposable element-derived protein 4-like [Dermacentor silvarum]|uniref:tigger transposable element-derived protein 4-like n=1 Tax=Dermacentor silvarum TaxID=543639 RepID=UPI00189B75D6|nr:tigger transposable element-derived protein 4-like [Dermacentor silvarum]XP_037576887.1 tigger transposable element-derived protein 4-like [Dermacentor silvarum]XP_049527120.1 tigger transposable element-derived protein 4-like [Dermacentor silvarum]
MATRGPYRTLDLATKVKIMKEVEERGIAKQDIARRYGIKPNTLSNFLKSKRSRLEAVEKDQFKMSRKRMRTGAHPELEQALLIWIREARSNHLPLSGDIVAAKALSLAAMLGIENFASSDGWLTRFKQRHDLVFKSVSGERASVDQETCATWREQQLREYLSEYKPEDIFNANETALFYKMLPEKTLTFKDDDCAGGKSSKERVSVLIATNMTGRERCHLLVLGKAAKPRCFKGVKTLPVYYASNRKAWMTSELFKDWLHKLDRKFASSNRKVLLLVDQCSAHMNVPALSAIRVAYLPANTTSVLQPMDQGIIKNVKVLYRKHLLERMLLCMESSMQYEVSVLSAIHMLAQAWGRVKEETIANCFRACAFSASVAGVGSSSPAGEADTSELDDQTLQAALSDVTFEEYVAVDGTVETCSALTDSEII